MQQSEDLQVTLPQHLAAELRQAVETGDYATSSEVICEALTEWNSRRSSHQSSTDRLRAAWQEAMQDGTPGLEPGPVLSRLKARYTL